MVEKTSRVVMLYILDFISALTGARNSHFLSASVSQMRAFI